jgi:alkaline phosphatase D
MLGDTPYIDSTELAVQRRRYREFFAVPELASLLRSTPLHAVWDDHDFGKNDTDGRLKGKEHSRQAFLEYHANPLAGDGKEGIYTSFRRGPVEVFLLDTRWFSGTEPSFADPAKTTLLGRTQWQWLTDGLKKSTATFKIIAAGMIWNGAVRPNKTDHWMNYPYERDALFRFIGDNRISGVVLVGGDIHRCRALRLPVEALAGYNLYEFIASPLANDVHTDSNVPTAALLHDAGEPHSFVLITADGAAKPPKLTAECRNGEGTVLFSVDVSGDELRARTAGGK